MKLPHLFKEIHGDTIFGIWVRDQRPIIAVVPQEPLGCVSVDAPITSSDTVTIVQVRCWNDRGTMQYEAATPADLKAAQEWAKRHKETPPESFKWLPSPLKS